MKKRIIVIGLVLLSVVGWAGATYVVGGQVEDRYLSLLEQYKQYGPITLSNQGYQRGFLSSTAQTILKMEMPKVAAGGQDSGVETLQLVFENSFYHGPLPFNSGFLSPALAKGETRLVSVSPSDEDFEKLLIAIPELADSVASFSVAFDGTMNSQVRIPAFEHQLDDAQIDWAGFQAVAEFGPGNKTLVGSFEMPQMNLHMAAGEISWSGLNGQFDLTETLPLLYVGTSAMVFGAMDINLTDAKSGQQKNVQMKGFEVTADSNFDGKLAGYNQTMTFAGITVDGETFGPGVCEVEVSNIDGEMLSSFQGQVQDLYRNGTSSSPDEVFAQILPLYTQMFEKLIEGTPEVNIKKLSFSTPMGDVDGKMLVKFAGHPGLVMDNPAGLLEYLEANADLTVDEDLVSDVMSASLIAKLKVARKQGQIPQYSDEELAELAERQLGSQIEGLLAQNFIVREGENLKSSARFNRGEFVLNGNPLPIFQTR